MTIEAGTRIGRYEIESLIAVGGMGEVYRARDHELHRSVALKFLSDEFASKPDRLNRFIQEARAASALNHPNIVTVYEIGRAETRDNAPFIATELIDGITLREHARKGIKLREVIDIAMQIASALVAAHESGIVHRDIKPDNIMIRPDGYVKVLDFGLAKPVETVLPAAEPEAATMALVKTERGALMGTVSYMSPEQARGQELDARTDIWSLGALLYELITGRTPFTGETPSHIIVSIIEHEPPPLAMSAADIPEAMEWIVAEALEKKREERTQSAREMLGRLRRLKQRIESGAEMDLSIAPVAGLSSGAPSNRSGRARTAFQAGETARSGQAVPLSSAEYLAGRFQVHRTKIVIAIVVAAVLVAGIVFGITRLNRNKPLTLGALKISRLTSDGRSSTCAISPDGKLVAQLYREGDKTSLVLRHTTATSSRELVAPSDGFFLGVTFSRDSNYVYYVKGERGSKVRSLFQVSTLGNDSRQLITDVDSAVTFSPDGKKLAFVRGEFETQDSALLIANSDGSGEEKLTLRKRPPFSGINSPAWSPDGKRIAFIVSGDDTDGYYVNIDEISLEGRVERKISAARWRQITSIGWLSDGSGLLAAARDRASIAGSPPHIWRIAYPNGEPSQVTSDLNYYLDLSVSADSKKIVASVLNKTSSVSVAPDGDTNRAREVLSKNTAGVEGVNWTTDGRIVYTAVERENRDLWIANADGSGQKQLTFELGADLYPAVTPDGRYIVFQSNRGDHWGLWRMNTDGSNPVELTRMDGQHGPPVFSADGRWVFSTGGRGGKQVIWKVSIDGGAPVPLNDDAMHSLAISPDGKQLAYFYISLELNVPLQIRIASAEDGKPIKTMPVVGDGRLLRWSPDGKSLDYVETRVGVGNIWRLPLDGGKPRQITDWKSDLIFWFAWSRDGKQLACARGTNLSDLVLFEASESN